MGASTHIMSGLSEREQVHNALHRLETHTFQVPLRTGFVARAHWS